MNENEVAKDKRQIWGKLAAFTNWDAKLVKLAFSAKSLGGLTLKMKTFFENRSAKKLSKKSS